MQGNNEKCAPLFLYVKVKTMINRMVCDSTPEIKNDIMLDMIHEVYVLVLTLNEEATGEGKKNFIISKQSYLGAEIKKISYGLPYYIRET